MDERRLRLYELSERQHGYITRVDVRTAGFSRDALRRLAGSPEWEVEGPRLLRRRGAPVTSDALLMRAVLDAGAGSVLSGPTAAACWGVPGFRVEPHHVTRFRYSTGAPVAFGQVLHEVVDLSADQVAILRGLPIVRPERCAFELHAMVSRGRAGRATEAMWSRRLLDGRTLRRIFAELAGRGRDGTVDTREFLEAHPVEWVPPDSGLEGRWMRVLAEEFGPDTWRRQVDVGGEAGWTGRVDFKHRSLPVVIEVQSELYHAALLDRAADAARKARLEADGFVVVEVWDTEVWNRPGAALRRVVQAVERALYLARLAS